MSLEKIKKRAKLIKVIHVTLLLFWIVAIFLLFVPLVNVYAALGIASVVFIQIANKGHCPLTVEERKAQKALGGKVNDTFVHDLIKDHLKLNVPNSVVNAIVIASFVGSLWVLSNYFIALLLNLL